MADRYYVLAPGVDVVGLENGRLLMKSDVVSLTLEGHAATFFRERVIPLLSGSRSLAELQGLLPEVTPDALSLRLEELTKARVLRVADHPIPARDGVARDDPVTALLEGLGVPRNVVERRLRTLHVAIVGLHSYGAWLADVLTRLEIGALTLIDPFSADEHSWRWLPHADSSAIDVPRQTWLQSRLERLGTSTRIRAESQGPLDKASVLTQAKGATFLAGCFGRALPAAQHWVNGASFAYQVPAIYAEVTGHRMLAGPMVLPGESPCFLCWKMRTIACSADFTEEMAYEEHLDRLRQPGGERPFLATLLPYTAGLLATEILKTVFAVGSASLIGKMVEFDPFAGVTTSHAILFRPDCPACKKKARRSQPELAALVNDGSPSSPLREERLVSSRCGIVRSLTAVTKDPSEPAQPHIYRAELANHRFADQKAETIICSGKGLTVAAAKAGALGEAVERYSGAVWLSDQVQWCRRGELDGESLDPRRLVLFHPSQYADLPYAAYAAESVIGWTEAMSLCHSRSIWVPALGVFMAYDVRSPQEYLFPITSNGLAAGASLTEAILAAACEVIERDAFLTTWFHRMPGRPWNTATIPDRGLASVVDSYERRGVAFELYQLSTDGPVAPFMALGVSSRSDDPAVVVGLGADLDPLIAIRSAILEVAQVRPALRVKLRDPHVQQRRAELVEHPSRVTSLEDHDLLYSHPSHLGSFDFLRSPSSAALAAAGHERNESASEKLVRLVEWLRSIGGDLIYANLTPLEFEDTGPFTARAILPDFQPIHFGHREARLGGDRLFELPAKLGHRIGRASLDDLNPDPHPLA